MRLKKIMSLVLACAMALSLVTVASAQDTVVYYAEDFSDYDDVPSFAKSLDLESPYTKDFSHGDSPKTIAATRAAHAAKATKTATVSWGISDYWNDETLTTNRYGEMGVNSFGSRSFRPLTKSVSDTLSEGNYNVRSGSLFIMPAETWDFVDNKKETYIISYEIEAAQSIQGYRHVGGADYYWIAGTYWTNEDGSRSARKKMFLSHRYPATEIVDEVTGEPVLNEKGKKTYKLKGSTGYEASSNYDNYSGTELALTDGQAYRIAYGTKYDETNVYTGKNGQYYEPVRVVAIDGEAWGGNATWLNQKTSNPSQFNHEGLTKIEAFYHGSDTTYNYGFSNIRMYTVKTNDFKAYVDQEKDVPPTQKTIRVKLSNPVAPSTFTAEAKAAIVVKKDGVVMGNDKYTISDLKTVIEAVGGEAYSYVDVTFGTLEEATTYTVEFPETIKNEIATPLTQTTATFTTKSPDVKVNSFTVVNAANLIADGSYQETKLNLANTTDATKSIAVIYAVYGANGQLQDMIYVNDEIVAEGTADIKVGAKFNSVGTLRAFTWDVMSSLKPYTADQELAIVAPAAAE